MATNISQLPQIAGSLAITTNSDWRDVFQFQWPQGSEHAGEPLDITGIAFQAQLRPDVASSEVLLDISTDNGGFSTDGQLGQLAFAIGRDGATQGQTFVGSMKRLPIAPAAVLDVIAMADGQVINLCQQGGPLLVSIGTGVTRV